MNCRHTHSQKRIKREKEMKFPNEENNGEEKEKEEDDETS